MITASTAHVYAMREREDKCNYNDSYASDILKIINNEIQSRALQGFFNVVIKHSIYSELNQAELDWIKNQMKLLGYGLYEDLNGLQICW